MFTIKKFISLGLIIFFTIFLIHKSDINVNELQFDEYSEVEIKQNDKQRNEIEPKQNEVQKQPKKHNPFSIRKTPKPLVIMLFGVDRSEGEQYGRSDSIMLAFAQPETRQLMLMSVPRDTYIHIPSYGYDKLNRAFSLGGPELTKKTISEWLGIEITESASIDYASFENLIDLIGGIEIEVDRNMEHSEFILEKGLQRLSGKEALYYVRFRKSIDGNHDSDYKRTERQRQLLSKLTNELLQVRSFAESYTLLRSLISTIDTSLSIKQIITYGYHYSDFSIDNITNLTFEGRGEKINGLWYEVISEEELEKKKILINDFMNPS